MSDIWRVQLALFNNLKDIAPVYEFGAVPDDAAYPYLTLNTAIEEPFRAQCLRGAEVRYQVDVWSDYAGKKDAARIAGAVRERLDQASVKVDGIPVHFEHEQTRIFGGDASGVVHGVLIFTGMTVRSVT